MYTRFLQRIACLVVCLVMCQIASAATIFVGQFDVSNFVFDADGGDGSIDTSLAPTLITLVGDDGGAGAVTSFLVTVASDATFAFYWEFDTNDADGAAFDPFGYYLNGSFTQLTDDSGLNSQGGFETVNLLAGDIFGFYTDSTDGLFGRSFTQIFGDERGGGEVPEPVSALLVLGGLGALAVLRRRR